MKKKLLHTTASFSRKAKEVEEGVIEAIVGSSNVIDRMGEVIDQAGWSLKNYMKNPVILWGHNVHENRPPIGKALKVWVDGDKKSASGKQKLMFKVKFDLQDNFAAEVYRKIKEGFLNTVSVGFIPLESEDNIFTKAELLELSVVPVPANPEAVVQIRDLGAEPVNLKDLFSKEPTASEVAKKEEKEEKNEKEEKSEPEEEKKESKDVDKELKEKGEKEEKKEEKAEEPEVILDIELTKEEFEALEKEAKEKETTIGALLLEKYQKGGPGSGRKPDKKTPKDLDDKEGAEDLAEQLEEKLDDKLDEDLEGRNLVGKGVIPFKSFETLPESTAWDGPGETSKADTADLKVMCTWYDAEKPDVKSSYKLPHHRQSDKKVVWRGVAAAMAALLGARGGVKIPDADRKGVYNHLSRHYKQFDKNPPEFRMVEEQVLATLEEEVQAVVLDREDKHIVRLVKKVLKETKETKKEITKDALVKRNPTTAEVKMSLEVLELALSSILVSSPEGGGKEG